MNPDYQYVNVVFSDVTVSPIQWKYNFTDNILSYCHIATNTRKCSGDTVVWPVQILKVISLQIYHGLSY